MRRIRIILLVALVALLLTGYVALRGLGLWGAAAVARARPVPRGDQEVAWIQAATMGAGWERFVDGIKCAQRRWPKLQVDYTNAFPDETTAVPEVALGLQDYPPRLRIRWYKLSSEANDKHWITELARRDPAPLAIIGGGNSAGARDLALPLVDQQEWHGTPPLLLLTTATSGIVSLNDADNVTKPLLDIYPGRTFRFCFENRQIARAVRDLLWHHPQLRPTGSPIPGLTAALATGLGGDPWAALAPFAHALYPPPPDVHMLTWLDDPYSLDLTSCFTDVFKDVGTEDGGAKGQNIPYSVGDYYNPNREEADRLQRLIGKLVVGSGQRHLLLLPATEKPARRVLRALAAAEPMEARNFIALTGDSFSLNVVYRDRDLAWDIRTMPVPLLFFAHQDPVAWPEPGSGSDRGVATQAPNATDDELLNAEVVQVLAEGAFGSSPGSAGPPALATSSDQLRDRLHGREPRFFTPEGDRVEGNGGFVVCLRPHTDNGRVLAEATLEVWERQRPKPGLEPWRLIKSLPVPYPAGEGGRHGG